MALPGRFPLSSYRCDVSADDLIKGSEPDHRRLPTSNALQRVHFPILIRKIKDVASCFSPKKREARSSD